MQQNQQKTKQTKTLGKWTIDKFNIYQSWLINSFFFFQMLLQGKHTLFTGQIHSQYKSAQHHWNQRNSAGLY